ncbi:MAG TPA: hypothetical protein VH639_07680 [Bryobacteraceae bacterium]
MSRLVAWCAFAALLLSLVGCSSPAQPQPKQAKAPDAFGPGPAAASGKNPLDKYLELSGFRLSENGAGKLKVIFAVTNHSEADMGDLAVKVRLVTSTFKPGDAPITEFDAKIPDLGPQETKDVTANAMTKLRLYELPDWQFLRADFDISSPAP